MAKRQLTKCHNCSLSSDSYKNCENNCPLLEEVPTEHLGIDRILLHRVWGKLIFILILFIMFFVMGRLIASDLTDFISVHFFDQILIPACRTFIEQFVAAGSLISQLFVGPYGILSMGLCLLYTSPSPRDS